MKCFSLWKKLLDLHEGIQKRKQILFDVRDRLEEVFQKTMGMTRSQNMSNKEKTALRILQRNKTVDVVINDTDKMSALHMHALIKKRSLLKAKDNCTKKGFNNQLT